VLGNFPHLHTVSGLKTDAVTLDALRECRRLTRVDFVGCAQLHDVSALRALPQLRTVTFYDCPQVSEADKAQVVAAAKLVDQRATNKALAPSRGGGRRVRPTRSGSSLRRRMR
jgi:hypothetical protein